MSTKYVRMSREDRQKQILSVALNVFVEKGYNGATTAEIAKAADISEVTLFRNFSSKKGIFKLSVEPIILTTLKESISASDNLNSRDQLEYILIGRVKLVSKHYEVIKLILMESQINEELKDINYIETMYNILKESVLDFGFEMKDKEFVMRMLMGSILSFLYMPETEETKIKKFVETVMKLLLNKTEGLDE